MNENTKRTKWWLAYCTFSNKWGENVYTTSHSNYLLLYLCNFDFVIKGGWKYASSKKIEMFFVNCLYDSYVGTLYLGAVSSSIPIKWNKIVNKCGSKHRKNGF